MTARVQRFKPGDPQIRLAETSDVPTLARLRYALRSSTGTATEPEADFLRRCAGWMQQHLNHSHWHCWVAEVEGELIGAIWLQLIEKIPNPRSEKEHHAYITNFYVRESARGSGIGSDLLKAATTWCRVHDVDRVVLWPTDRSRSLYNRHGFAVRDDVMELIVE